MVRDERGLLELTRRRLRARLMALLRRRPHRGLGHAVEVDVVLPDELVDPRLGIAPPPPPLIALMTAVHEAGRGERDRRPEGFGPAPDGEPVLILELRGGNAPLDVAGQTERHERLARAEPQPVCGQHIAGLVTDLDILELESEGLLALLGRQEDMGRKFLGQGTVFLLQVVLDVDDGRDEELPDRGGHHIADIVPLRDLVDILHEQRAEARQLEVPVHDIAHGGRLAGDGALRGDQVDRHVLVSQVAFIGIPLLRLAAGNRTASDDLATVQEGLGLLVIELRRRTLLEIPVLIQPPYEQVGEPLVHRLAAARARTLVDVEGDVIGVQRLLLCPMVLLHIVGDAALETLFPQLPIALVDGGAITVGARDEHDVLGADAVTQEPGIAICGNEHPRDMTEMKTLVAIGHPCRDDGPLGESRTRPLSILR